MKALTTGYALKSPIAVERIIVINDLEQELLLVMLATAIEAGHDKTEPHLKPLYQRILRTGAVNG